MKNLILIVCLLFTIQAHTQVTFRVREVIISKLNKETKEFHIVQTSQPDNMTLMVFGNLFTVTNKAKSNYRIFDQPIKRTTYDYRENEWQCTDDENIRCRLALIRYNNGKTIIFITYSDILIAYEIENI